MPFGGFKESFSFSFRICQTCLVTNDEFRSCFKSSDYIIQRTDSQHEQHCQELSGPMGDHYSKVYGINRRSILMDVPYFSLFGGSLPHDLMHDILEGVAQHEMTLLRTYTSLLHQ